MGFVDNEKSEVVGKDNRIYSVLGKTDELEKIISLHRIEQAIISYAKFTSDRLQKILRICSQYKLNTRMVPHFHNVSVQRIQVENLMGIPLLGINTPRLRWLCPKIKRVLDVVISAGILVCLSPLMLIIALLIKKDSPGPIIFSQEKVGQDGRLFKIYKFRRGLVLINTYLLFSKCGIE